MVLEINPVELFGRGDVFAKVSQEIAPGDGMMNPDHARHYFVVGASASAIIHDGLRTARLDPAKVGRVLDYACGYGRVLRWLAADFPHAKVLGVDADPKAARAAADALGVETRALDLALDRPIDAPFDLIWVGSLFTHLPEEESRRVLDYLQRHLTDTGVLVFTTHGEIVRNRLAQRERSYGLDDAGVARVLDELAATGYGFASYPHSPGYGISVARPSHVMRQMESAGLAPVLFKDRGWAAHQDVYACRKAG